MCMQMGVLIPEEREEGLGQILGVSYTQETASSGHSQVARSRRATRIRKPQEATVIRVTEEGDRERLLIGDSVTFHGAAAVMVGEVRVS